MANAQRAMTKKRNRKPPNGTTIKTRATLWSAAPAFLWHGCVILLAVVAASLVAARWQLGFIPWIGAAVVCAGAIAMSAREWRWTRSWRYKLTPYWLRIMAPGAEGGVIYINLLEVADCRVERDRFPSGLPMYGHVVVIGKPNPGNPFTIPALRDPEAWCTAIKSNAKAWRARQGPGSDKERHLKRYYEALREHG